MGVGRRASGGAAGPPIGATRASAWYKACNFYINYEVRLAQV